MQNLAPTRHSKFSPSSAHRWMHCHASLVLPQPTERTTSPEAEEGTAAHELAAWCMTEGHFDATQWTEPTASNGVAVTDEMKEFVQVYLNNILEYWTALSEGDDNAKFLVEAEVDYSGLVGLEAGEATGTSDCLIIAPAAGIVSVHDLKYGRGVDVDAVDNEQLRIYALGAITAYPEETDGCFKVQTVIHQVRKQRAPKEDSILMSDLLEFADEVGDAVTRINMLTVDELELRDYAPDEHACRFCPHKADCPAVVALVDAMFEDITGESMGGASAERRNEVIEQATRSVEAIDDAAIDRIYPSIALIEGWIKAFTEHVESRLNAGAKLATAKLVMGREGNRAWSDPEAVEALFKKTFRFKNEDMYKMSLIGIPAAEKLLKDNPTRWARVQELIVRASPKPVLAPASDKRPAVEPVAFVDESNNIDDLI